MLTAGPPLAPPHWHSLAGPADSQSEGPGLDTRLMCTLRSVRAGGNGLVHSEQYTCTVSYKTDIGVCACAEGFLKINIHDRSFLAPGAKMSGVQYCAVGATQGSLPIVSTCDQCAVHIHPWARAHNRDWSVCISTPAPVLTIGTGSAPGSPECVQQYSIVPPCPVQCTPRASHFYNTPSLHAGRRVRISQNKILWDVIHNFGAEIAKCLKVVQWFLGRPSISILVKDETLQTR